MVAIFVNNWYQILEQLSPNLPWLANYPRPPKTKRHRLFSNVQLYHSSSGDPRTDLLETDEVMSDNVDDGFCDTIIEDVEDFDDY